MKKLFIIIVSTTIPAYASNGYNLSFFGGATLNSSKITQSNIGKDFKSGMHFGVEYGYNYNGFLMGISGAGITTKISNTEKNVTSSFGLVNIGYQFNNEGIIKPYLGIGVGMGSSKVEQDNTEDLKTKNAFVSQGRAGISFTINNYIESFVDYRLTMFSSAKYQNTTTNTDTKLQYNSVNLGVKILLGKHDQHFDFHSRRRF